MGLEASTWHKSGSSMGLFTQSHWCRCTRLPKVCRIATTATGRLVPMSSFLHQGAVLYPALGDECRNSRMVKIFYCICVTLAHA